MRKVIKGKLYDTDKARKVAEWDNARSVTDFSHCEETLYRKRTGEYFIHGAGGPRSPYARESYEHWVGGEAIRPVSYDEARDWMERYASADEYESEFGIADDDASHDLHVIVSEAAWQALSREAADTGATIGAVVERLASTL